MDQARRDRMRGFFKYAMPPEKAARYSERIQRLLGYDVVHGTFFGHVDGRDPIKLIPR